MRGNGKTVQADRPTGVTGISTTAVGATSSEG